MATLDIIIVNWNTGGRLAACLESIAAARRNGFELLRVCVVDNASTDESADVPAELTGDAGIPLGIIRNPDNRGFAAACNQGAAGSAVGSAVGGAAGGAAGSAVGSAAGSAAGNAAGSAVGSAAGGAADYLLFLNPDTRLFADSLSVPVAFMEQRGTKQTGMEHVEMEQTGVEHVEKERIGVVGIKLVGDDGAPHRACARFPAARHFLSRSLGLDILFPRLFPSYRMINWPHDETRVVDQVTGAFFMVRREVFRALGGFDERFFVYMEELDFSRRMHNAGWKSVYLADAAAYHKGGGASETDRGRRLFYVLRSRLVYAYKHFAPPAAVTIALCTLVVEPFVRLVAALLRGSAVRLRETVSGFVLLWREAPGIMKMIARITRAPR